MEQLAVILCVIDYKRPGAERPPSLGFLAFGSGLSTDVFRERLTELQQAELLEVRGTEEALEVTVFGLVRAILVSSGLGELTTN